MALLSTVLQIMMIPWFSLGYLLSKTILQSSHCSHFKHEETETQISFKRASLVAQWLRVCLLMRGTRVRALVWEDPTCRGATGPVSHNYCACTSGACAPQQERPQQWEAHAPRWGVAPARRNWRKPSHRDEDPTQPKINIYIYIYINK